VDEIPFNDGSEAANPEAIELFNEMSVPTARYDSIDMVLTF